MAKLAYTTKDLDHRANTHIGIAIVFAVLGLIGYGMAEAIRLQSIIASIPFYALAPIAVYGTLKHLYLNFKVIVLKEQKIDRMITEESQGRIEPTFK